MQITGAPTVHEARTCAETSRRFSDSFSAKLTAGDAARMNIVKIDEFRFDSAAGIAYVRFCGDSDLVRAAVRTFQTW